MSDWKSKIKECSLQNPTFGHKRIAKALGCSEDIVRYHRAEDRRKYLHRTTKERMRRHKLILIEEAGGSCQLCGYNKVPQILQFHHLDPSKKEFAIANCRSLELKRAEIKKCQLLCPNCHAEFHHNETI